MPRTATLSAILLSAAPLLALLLAILWLDAGPVVDMRL